MSDALTVTGADLVRALGAALTSPAVDQAVRRRAENVARDVRDAAGGGAVTGVVHRNPGDWVISVEGPGLFAREFGSADRPGDAVIARAVAGMKR